MAERYHSSRKSKKYHKSERKEKDYTYRRKHKPSDENDIKTPPLPFDKDKSSIGDLIKRRNSLKRRLEKYNESDKHKSNQSITNNKHTMNKNEKRELSPEIEAFIDSEDEDSIIEKRRKQRQELLAKLDQDQTSMSSDMTDVREENFSYSKKSNGIECKNFEKTDLTKNMSSSNTNDDKDEPSTYSEKSNGIENKNEGKIELANNCTADMFSENNEFDVTKKDSQAIQPQDSVQLTDDWDDTDFYYKARIGESLNNNRYVVKNIVGQGMFANVIQAIDSKRANCNVAIKIARNNVLMYKNGLKEVEMLKEVNDADPEDNHYCVRYLRNFMHRGHLCIVLESLNMDLRMVLRKYGKTNGLSLQLLVSYSLQLLSALELLKKLGIIHADIKPDNILVNEKKNIIKLCDFGTAEKNGVNEPKPYLVSRFYRAPEIILGMAYDHSIDLWSTACTIYELATGNILFAGSSNNKMLKRFMDLKGKIPNKIIRKGKFKDQHFNYNNNFLLHTKDKVTGRDKVVEVTNIIVTRNLFKELKKGYKNFSENENKKIVQLKEFLDKILMIDPSQRLSVTECQKHPFIREKL